MTWIILSQKYRKREAESRVGDAPQNGEAERTQSPPGSAAGSRAATPPGEIGPETVPEAAVTGDPETGTGRPPSRDDRPRRRG